MSPTGMGTRQLTFRSSCRLRNSEQVGREGDTPLGAADSDHLVLEGLAQHLEVGMPELRKLVQKEDAAMAQGNLPGPGPPASPHAKSSLGLAALQNCG